MFPTVIFPVIRQPVNIFEIDAFQNTSYMIDAIIKHLQHTVFQYKTETTGNCPFLALESKVQAYTSNCTGIREIEE